MSQCKVDYVIKQDLKKIRDKIPLSVIYKMALCTNTKTLYKQVWGDIEGRKNTIYIIS